MKYRKLDANGDYIFGGSGEFHVDTPEGVAQAIKTRLLLMTYEWFLDSQEGTAYSPDIIGYGTAATRDPAIIDRILGTPGVQEILQYSSSVDAQRVFRVNALVQSINGIVAIIQSPVGPIPVNPPGPTPSPPPPAPAPSTQAIYLFHFQADEFHEESEESGTATDQTGGEWDFRAKLDTVNYKFGSASLVQDISSEDTALRRTSTSKFSRLGRDITIFDGWLYVSSEIYEVIEETIQVPLLIVETQKDEDGGTGSNIVINLHFNPDFGELSLRAFPQDDDTTPAFKTFFSDVENHVRICIYFLSEEEAVLKIWFNGQSGEASTSFNPGGINSMVYIGPEIEIGPFEDFKDFVWIDEVYGQFGALNPIDEEDFTPPTQEWPPSDVAPIPPAEAWNYEDDFDDFGVSILSHVPLTIPENCTGWGNSSPEYEIDPDGGVGALHSGLYLYLDGVEQPPNNYPDTVIQFRWDHREPANEAIASLFGSDSEFAHMFEVLVYSQDYPIEGGKVVLKVPTTQGGSNVEVGTGHVGSNDVAFQLILHGTNIKLYGDGNLQVEYDFGYQPIKYPQFLGIVSDGGQIDGSDKTFLTGLYIYLTNDHA